MAKDKKSAVIYTDWINIFEELDDVEAGQLIKHLFRYINDQNPEPPSRIIKLVFEPLKQSLKRDLRRYEDKRLKNIDNANKRWNNKDATACDRINSDAKHAVSDNVSVSVSDNVNDKKINNSIELLERKKLIFHDSLIPFVQEFSKDTIRDFYDYWSEIGKNNKMRFELQKTWETKLRLNTWKRNESNFNKNGTKQPDKTIIGATSKVNGRTEFGGGYETPDPAKYEKIFADAAKSK